eukprot:scaffold7197_cov88-Skeletonema_menzelii.AAC.13
MQAIILAVTEYLAHHLEDIQMAYDTANSVSSCKEMNPIDKIRLERQEDVSGYDQLLIMNTVE